MTKEIAMNDRQKELINIAHAALEASREKRDMNVLLEGMAAGLEGKLVNADTDRGVFTVEVPDIEDITPAEKPKK